MATDGDLTHQAISSYFIGPQAENLHLFKENIAVILDELRNARQSYFPSDGVFITKNIQSSAEFKRSTDSFSRAVRTAAQLLGKHSVPFWSPRYEAHMASDLSMPALLGYFMAMIYNQNNVALEVSPLTTVAEMEVGDQLCRLFGYNVDATRKDVPTGWGHLTSGGTVANLESIWVARNLKFYPLALRRAIDEGSLRFIADQFKVPICVGEEKFFSELTTWELLNLRANTILSLPQMLEEQFGISPKFVAQAIKKYNIQSTGKDALERHFNIDQPIQYMLGKTRHYSWPKGGAVAGIGSDNMVGVEVDDRARVDLKDLESHLERSLQNKQAVFAVVAIIGSTEEGAVDRLSRILAIRQRFQARGLSFLVHADAAWGGYFATMLPRNIMDSFLMPRVVVPSETLGAGAEGFVPDLSLKVETQEDLMALKYADSITVDPHKAGYIPYPSGCLVYRDGRMRHLVTWTSPVLSRGSETGIGIYGIEGSKPGAAAMATWLSNKCIGLDPSGYGALLSEVSFTSTRLSAHWAAMTTDSDSFVCVPFHLLPSEIKENSTPEDIEAEKARIRTEILEKSNTEIITADNEKKEVDSKTMTLLRGLGSDLNVNLFALNWRYRAPDGSPGELNTDVEEATFLMQRVIERVSVDSPEDDPTTIPFYLTSTEFEPELYGSCAETFKSRLGLKDRKEAPQNLFVLRNVVMSPFPTDGDFIGSMVKTFRDIVEEEVEVCRQRNDRGPAIHVFLMQGTDEIFLVSQSSFYLAKYRQQLVISVELDADDLEIYRQIKKTNHRDGIYLQTSREISLDEILKDFAAGHAEFQAQIYNSHGLLLPSATVRIRRILKNRPLSSVNRDPTYPVDEMPFYLYGTANEHHLSHILLRAPNIALLAGNVNLELDQEIPLDQLSRGVILSLTNIHEASRQPFPEKNADLLRSSTFFFRAGQSFPVKVWQDPKVEDEGAEGILQLRKVELATGTVTLGDDVQVDVESVNRDIFHRIDKVDRWRHEFSEIGRQLKG